MEQLIEQFEGALKSVNRLEVKEVFQKLCEAIPLLRIPDIVFVPILNKLGEEWERGDVSLSQIYMSGKICQELIDTAFTEKVEKKEGQPKIAIAVLEDYHVLGKNIIRSILLATGYNVIDYDRVGVDELVSNTVRDDIEILLISVLMISSALRVKEVIEKIEKAGRNIKVVVGGAPFRFDKKLWQEVKSDAMGENAADAIAIINRLTGGDI